MRPLLAGLVTLVALDFLWIGTVASGFYLDNVAVHLRLVDGRMDARVGSALATWLCIVGGIRLFVLPRAEGQVRASVAWGALYGLLLYGVYDLTNHALFHSWPPVVVAVDMAWGTTLCAAVAASMAWAIRDGKHGSPVLPGSGRAVP